MGTRKRPKPERLAEKLQQIRFSLGFSQNELVTHLGLQDVIAYNKISHYERDAREPAWQAYVSTCSLMMNWIFRRSYPGLPHTEGRTLQRPSVVAHGKRV